MEPKIFRIKIHFLFLILMIVFFSNSYAGSPQEDQLVGNPNTISQELGFPKKGLEHPQQVPFDIIKQVAIKKAKSLWGDDFAFGPIIPMCDFSGYTIAFEFSFKLRTNRFPDYSQVRIDIELEKKAFNSYRSQMISAENGNLNGKEKPHIQKTNYRFMIVSARYDQIPIPTYGEGASDYFLFLKNIQKKISLEKGYRSCYLHRIFYYFPREIWFEFKNEKQGFVFNTFGSRKIEDTKSFLNLVKKQMPKENRNENFRQSIFEEWNQLINSQSLASNNEKFIIDYNKITPLIWHFGCTPTAASMVLSYWDNAYCYGRLIDYYFYQWTPAHFGGDGYANYSVTNTQNILKEYMHTNEQGNTFYWDIEPALVKYINNDLGYNFSFQSISLTSSDLLNWLFIKDEIDNNRPFIFGRSWIYPYIQHSTCAFGYSDDGYVIYQDPEFMNKQSCKWYGGLGLNYLNFMRPGSQKCPNIHLTAPTQNSPWLFGTNKDLIKAGSDYLIKWNSNPVYNEGYVQIYLATDGHNYNQIICEYTPNNGEFLWENVPMIRASEARIKILLRDNSNNLVASDSSMGPFSIYIEQLPGKISISPSDSFLCRGNFGGPFSCTKTYTVTNIGDTAVNWNVQKTLSQNWVTLAGQTSGALGPDQSAQVTVSVNTNANSLSAATYTERLQFSNLTNSQGNCTKDVVLTVDPPSGSMQVTPTEDFISKGTVSGPFNPASNNYVLKNVGGSTINIQLSSSASWVGPSITSRTLTPGEQVTLSVNLYSGAESLGAGDYSALISFQDITNSKTIQRNVYLTIGTIHTPSFISYNFSTCETNGYVNLNWGEVPGARYSLERSTSPSFDQNVLEVNSNKWLNSYTDGNPPSGYYWYRVKAYNNTISSDWVKSNHSVTSSFSVISGYMRDGSGNPIKDVAMKLSTGGQVLTGPDGYYKIEAPCNWTGQITPEKPGFSFSPASFQFNNVVSPQTKDFTGTIQYFTISGYVKTSSAIGISGVTMNGLPHLPSTDVNGFFTDQVNYGWSGLITPSKLGLAFSPENYTYTAVSTNFNNQDFIGSVQLFSLNPPSLMKPSNGSSDQLTNLLLEWQDLNVNPQEQGYRIRYKVSGENYIYLTTSQDSTSYQFSSLSPNTLYYWNIQALGDGNTTLDSLWANSETDWSFTTSSVSLPEINIKQGTNSIASGGEYSFGTKAINSNTDCTFTIENLGNAPLTLSGNPIVTISGANSNQFSVQQQPVSPVAGGETATFVVRFAPTSSGTKTTSLSIANNDANENPYIINLTGNATTGVAPGAARIDPLIGTLHYIPSGTFTQGSPTSEISRNSNEAQFTHILTKNLWVMETEATRQMWADLKAVQPTLPADPSNAGYSPGMEYPLQKLTWNEALLFANLLSLQNGLTRCYYTDAAYSIPVDSANYNGSSFYCNFDATGYRLPTEGEWEFFVRAGMTTPFSINEPNYNGSTFDSCTPGVLNALESVGWYCVNAGGLHHPVGLKLANSWGLKDVHGSVFEWVWDTYGDYPSGTVTDYRGLSQARTKVIRSGTIGNQPHFLRSAYRGSHWSDTQDEAVGIRLVRLFRDQDMIIYSVSLTKGGAGSGQVKVNGVAKNLPYSESFFSGSTVNLEAAATSGSTFTGWTGEIVSSAEVLSITNLSANKNLVANFSIVAGETVSMPTAPTGPSTGTIATSYAFSTGGSTSSLGHSVQYKFDWDDGTDLGWRAVGITTASHSWSANGTYHVRAVARCVTHTAIESLWSDTHNIVISDSGHVSCDFNSDGQTDIVWQNASTGRNICWYMNGVARTASVYLPTQDTAWSIVGCADFNADGKTDILFWNPATGRNIVWYMNGVTRTGSVYLPTQDTAWTNAGPGEFNNDGKPDIVWRNPATGRNIVWYMNGVTRTGSVYLPTQDAAWTLAGRADFNGDGKTDIVWWNAATGRNICWYMNGVARTGSVYLPTQDTAWENVGSGDFNADGKPDMLWRNKTTGKNICWYMNGVARTGSVYLPTQPDLNWKLVN